jgi:adenylate cyclase
MKKVDTPSPEEIRAQLVSIFTSNEFQAARRLQDFLRYVVEKSLQDEQNTIKQFTIAIDVYNRPDSFEPKSDPLIRIEAQRLRRALARFYENNSDADVLIHIPRGTYVPQFSWNKTSINTEPDKSASQPVTSSKQYKPTIGVFPFEYTGNDNDMYLADGLAEELVDQLCQFPYLRMLSFSTTSRFRNVKENLADVCASLGIDIALTGSLKLSKDKIYYCCKLQDMGTGEQIWSYKNSTDISITKMLNCEEEILAGISSRIADTCGVLSRYLLDKLNTSNQRPATFEAILRCHHYQQNTIPENFVSTRSALERAILNDPKNPTLLAYMGEIYIDADIFGFADIPDAIDKGAEYASLAVTLDPNSQIAHHSRAYAAFIQHDKKKVIESARRIIEINQHAASMVATAGFWLCLCGQYDEGMKWFSHGTRLNPMYERWLHAAPYFYFLHQENYDEALKHARDFEMPGFFWGNIMRVAVLGLMGKSREARQEYVKLLELKPDFPPCRLEIIESFVLDEDLANRMLCGIDTVGDNIGTNTIVAKNSI